MTELDAKIATLPSQARRVAEYMRDRGSYISSREAIVELSCTRLAARIHEMRRAKIDVVSRYLTSTNRFDERVRFKAYRLAPSGEAR